MAIFTVVGKRGMIYIPKPIREKARLEERMNIEIDLNEDGNVIIKKSSRC